MRCRGRKRLACRRRRSSFCISKQSKGFTSSELSSNNENDSDDSTIL